MKMLSDCSGECCVCAHSGFCLAGHGDDDFTLASKDKIIKYLNNDEYSDYRNYMTNTLYTEFGYDYYKDCPMKINDEVKIVSDNTKGIITKIYPPVEENGFSGRFIVSISEKHRNYYSEFWFSDYNNSVVPIKKV